MAAHGISVTSQQRRLLTVSEAAEVLGYKSVNPVYNLIAAGEIPTVSLPVRGGTRVDEKDLDVFIERMKRSA
jgi:excisionase family DNA binding protein